MSSPPHPLPVAGGGFSLFPTISRTRDVPPPPFSSSPVELAAPPWDGRAVLPVLDTIATAAVPPPPAGAPPPQTVVVQQQQEQPPPPPPPPPPPLPQQQQQPQPQQQQQQHQPQPQQSLFPQYNSDLPLALQQYFPAHHQTSPRHFPHHHFVLGRGTSLGTEGAADEDDGLRTRYDGAAPPKAPKSSSAESLKSLWRVANGWRAPPSEGRVYCLRMTREGGAPMYTLAGAAGLPFYSIRLDPTSVSAKVTLRRRDPTKPYRGPNPSQSATTGASSPLSPSGASVASGGGPGTAAAQLQLQLQHQHQQQQQSSTAPSSPAEDKHWQDVLCTALEEKARRHAPRDGLVSLLYPAAASRAALGRAGDPSTVVLAERECARLVWDDDSGSHFLVHPALALPFRIAIERTPAWSRVEYALEHPESPRHVARLTRDGTGAGWLEIDTRLAAMIDAYYLVDVAVAALLIVASGDETFSRAETFAPPPGAVASSAAAMGVSFPPPPPPAFLGSGGRRDRKAGRKQMDEFEMDVESQSSSYGGGKPSWSGSRRRRRNKGGDGSDELMDGLPVWARCMVGSLTMVLKCLLWCISLMFRAVARCLGYK